MKFSSLEIMLLLLFFLRIWECISEKFLPLCQNSPHPQQTLFVVSTNLNETFLMTISTSSGRLIHLITTEPLPVMETLDQAKQALKNLSTPELKTKIKDIIQSRDFKLAIIQCGGFPRAVEETLSISTRTTLQLCNYLQSNICPPN